MIYQILKYIKFPPLYVAIENNHVINCITALIEKKEVNINLQDNKEKTPLQLAAENGREGVYIRFLINKGANRNLPDNNNLTPLDMAERYSRDANCINALTHHSAKENQTNAAYKDNAHIKSFVIAMENSDQKDSNGQASLPMVANASQAKTRKVEVKVEIKVE
ncbi:ankyrin repeat domain-containing protein [Candidatus Cardinium hertigii]|uniref:Uncharacterized protein n=1 Tax=Candidatus Cardinium hertigii TaxID=247481 RepID=A0A2Z3LGN3_9BACT|nr:ankyrin repeat domain-containing protein [Candidatus Cardinium hertigii]AWN81544.1 hypothetical protein DK880_00212 [Candidatus Cardinium hertigii]